MGRHWLYESTHLSNVYFVSTSSFEKMALIEKKNNNNKRRKSIFLELCCKENR